MELNEVKGIGEVTYSKLADLDINSVGGLLSFFPSKYVNLQLPISVLDAEEGQFCLLAGEVISSTEPSKRGTKSFTVTFLDCIANRRIFFKSIFFNQPYLKNEFTTGRKFRILTKMSYSNGIILLSNPIVEPIDKIKHLSNGIYTFYPLKSILGQRTFKNLIENTIDNLSKQNNYDKLENDIFAHDFINEMIDAKSLTLQSIKQIHFPNSEEELNIGYENLASIDFACGLYNYRKNRSNASKQRKVFYNFDKNRILLFENALKITLTPSQKQAICQIDNDLTSNKTMSRIVSGDVGSGKSVVAYFALYEAFLSKKQAVYMCPTEILASQQYEKFLNIASRFNINAKLLTSSTSYSERKQILYGLKSGNIDILFGTQSLIGKDVEYNSLTIAVIDEQHKFGVSCRAQIEEKGACDILTLTATPIPRTLALTVYDDIDVSRIEKREEAKTNITTKIISDSKLDDMLKYIATQCSNGEQAFIICPTIKDCDGIDLYSIEQFSQDYLHNFSNLTVSILHGKMSNDEKNSAMEAFSNKKTSVLIATSLVEVGIDTKANIIAILNADRFGLASLHQLRGRVGRDGSPAYCFLHTKVNSDKSIDRLSAMVNFNDGNLLAEKDLEMRGAGEMLGYHQSGKTTTPYFGLPLNINVLNNAKNILSSNQNNGEMLNSFFDEVFNADFTSFVQSLENITLNS